MEALPGSTTVGKSHSSLNTMNQCFDCIPIFYKVVAVADTLTRQTFGNTNVQTSLIASRTFSKEKHEKKKIPGSHLLLHPKLGPTHFLRTKRYPSMITRSFPGSQCEGMYTPNNYLIFGPTLSLPQHH